MMPPSPRDWMNASTPYSNRKRPTRAWLQVAGGKFALKTYSLKAGDAVELTNETEITVEAHAPSEVMVFDLPGT